MKIDKPRVIAKFKSDGSITQMHGNSEPREKVFSKERVEKNKKDIQKMLDKQKDNQ